MCYGNWKSHLGSIFRYWIILIVLIALHIYLPMVSLCLLIYKVYPLENNQKRYLLTKIFILLTIPKGNLLGICRHFQSIDEAASMGWGSGCGSGHGIG